MTDSPEIKRLRSHTLSGTAPADVAIQAVRDTEARVIREAVEALRERSGQSRAGADAGAGVWYEGAADFLSYRFLSHPDNPEGT